MHRSGEMIEWKISGPCLELSQILHFGADVERGLDIDLVVVLSDGGEDEWENGSLTEGYFNIAEYFLV